MAIRVAEDVTALETFRPRQGATSVWVSNGLVSALKGLKPGKDGKMPALVVPPEDLGISEDMEAAAIRSTLAKARASLRAYLRKSDKPLFDRTAVSYGPDGLIVTLKPKAS